MTIIAPAIVPRSLRNHVSVIRFGYEDCRPVLRDMNFRIAAGETVAIAGMNGSGKSTIGLLATRLYEPESG
jgi:ABC-type multidrug transport system fused ATPase/permease subunit